MTMGRVICAMQLGVKISEVLSTISDRHIFVKIGVRVAASESTAPIFQLKDLVKIMSKYSKRRYYLVVSDIMLHVLTFRYS